MAVIAKIVILIISAGAVLAGWGFVRATRRMRSYQTTRGTVIGRELAAMPLDTREGRWGKGGGYQPKVTYVYTVGGVSYTSDRWSYAAAGLRHDLAQKTLDAVPDQVDVHYDPRAPQQACLQIQSPGRGYLVLIGGALGMLAALAALVW